MASRLDQWYDDKHRNVGDEEIALVNSIAIADCPFCGSAKICRAGFRRDGIRLILCKGCGRRFNPLTGTLFDSRKIPVSEWLQFIYGLAGYASLSLSSGENMNAKSTGKYWILKLFSLLDGCQDGVILKGTVTIDETFFPAVRGDLVRKGGKKLRGISRNQLAVATAVDEDGHILLVDEGVSKPSTRSTLRCYAGHIAPGSMLLHDGAPCHAGLIKALGLKDKVFPSKKYARLPADRNPLQAVDTLHSFLKKFMRNHSSFKRKDLQGWLNLFWAIARFKGGRLGFIKWILERALTTRKVLRYRSAFLKT